MKFEQLGLKEPLLKTLNNEGYVDPTPIQEKAIPVILSGKDILGCAQTGTGKTRNNFVQHTLYEVIRLHKTEQLKELKVNFKLKDGNIIENKFNDVLIKINVKDNISYYKSIFV